MNDQQRGWVVWSRHVWHCWRFCCKAKRLRNFIANSSNFYLLPPALFRPSGLDLLHGFFEDKFQDFYWLFQAAVTAAKNNRRCIVNTLISPILFHFSFRWNFQVGWIFTYTWTETVFCRHHQFGFICILSTVSYPFLCYPSLPLEVFYFILYFSFPATYTHDSYIHTLFISLHILKHFYSRLEPFKKYASEGIVKML